MKIKKKSAAIVRNYISCSSLFLLFLFLVVPAIGQSAKQRVYNDVPEHIPIKIEIKNNDTENVLETAEIEITNTGHKPIYYLYFLLNSSDVKSPFGNPIGFPLRFGRKDLIVLNELARKDDEAIHPNEKYIFKVPQKKVQKFNERQGVWKYVSTPKKYKLVFQLLNYGDRTGFSDSSGSPYPDDKLGLISIKVQTNLLSKL